MAKPTTYATPICLVLSILALLGIYLGFHFQNALYIILFLLPAVGYEAYRTEGESTRWASWVLLLLILAELYFIFSKTKIDLAGFFQKDTAYVGGYFVPLGDLRILTPAVMAVLAVILFVRTNGKYTKWLSVIIIVSALATVYKLDPNILKSIIGFNLMF